MTLKQVNIKLEELYGVGKIELVKGDGYFWFTGADVKLGAESVYVNSLNQLSLEEWLSEAKERLVMAGAKSKEESIAELQAMSPEERKTLLQSKPRLAKWWQEETGEVVDVQKKKSAAKKSATMSVKIPASSIKFKQFIEGEIVSLFNAKGETISFEAVGEDDAKLVNAIGNAVKHIPEYTPEEEEQVSWF